jgi:hypothetical protein
MNGYAPIALFVYRRMELLNHVLDALEACPEFSESNVFVFSDGPKTPVAAVDVAAVRALILSRLKPNMRLVEAPQNKGLANSIIDGVTRLCNEYGRVIVIEDDLIVSPVILAWFNNALERYADEPRVMQISGHMFDVPQRGNQHEGIFLPMTTSWGWATWKRAWDMFDPDAKEWELIAQDKRLRRRFEMDGAYPYGRMLQRQMRGEIDSWAIRWYWSVFQREGLVLFPPKTLVLNVGFDGQATHGGFARIFRRLFWRRTQQYSLECPSMPERVTVEERDVSLVRRAIRR